jgi:hypothetical protein
MSLSSHIKIIARKTKNQLHNTDHKVAEGIYVAGTLQDGEASFYCSGQWRRSTPISYTLNNGLQTHSR